MVSRAAVASMALLAAACDDPVAPLAPDAGSIGDAGTERDAGPEVSGDAGPPPPDAGNPTDAGEPPPPPDAGPQCEFDDNPVLPFECEGDEDFCLPIPDRPEPAGDLLAGWSRVEGEEVVIELRFLAAPFRQIDAQFVRLLFEHNLEPPYEELNVSTSPEGQVLWGGQSIQLTNSYYLYERGYPPPVRDAEPEGYDFCQVSFGIASPVMRLRVPLEIAANADGSVRYAVAVASPGPDEIQDTSWRGGPKHFETPLGGTANEIEDLLGICEMDCSDGALP